MSNMKRITVRINKVIANYDPEADRVDYIACAPDDLKDLIEALQAIEYLIARSKPIAF